MDEHVVHNDCDLQLSSSTLQGNFNYPPDLAENTLYQQHIPKAKVHETYSVPQQIGYQQMAPYIEYLLGNGHSDIQEERPYENTGIGCSFTSDESYPNMDSHQVRDSRLQHEEILFKNFRNAQHQLCYQNQEPQEDQLDMSALTSGINPLSRTHLRQKATDADRRRRTRIATALDALEDLLPMSKEGNKANIVDDCMDYIKYLQLQMKELSQNRLTVSEPASNHLAYLEGYGYYIVDENMASGPLQDMVGNLLETNPTEASKLLESRGLYMMMQNAPN